MSSKVLESEEGLGCDEKFELSVELEGGSGELNVRRKGEKSASNRTRKAGQGHEP